MKIKNWLEAQQIIFFWQQILDTILLENNIGATTRWHLVEFWKDYANKHISEFIPENRKELFDQVMQDIEEAKQFLQELNK